MGNSKISINLIVLNGEKYIRQCLESVFNQTYRDFELIIFDNGSTDGTIGIIEQEFENCELIKMSENLGTWGGFEESLKYTTAKYSILLSVDVILDKDFLKNALPILENDEKIGGLQAKIYQYNRELIDTCGFQIFRSRRLINIGHGELDSGQFNEQKEIFAVEGAVPIFRRAALENCRINGEIVDHDMFWYGDDLDLAWRMRLFGWKQIYAPNVVAYHDRSTTKTLSKNIYDFIKIRKSIPMFKRRLDYRNFIFCLIKNDFAVDIIHDLPYILYRQVRLWIYFTFFEPSMYLEIFNIIKLLPKMLKKRRVIMKYARTSPKTLV